MLGEGNTVQDCLRVANLKEGFYGAVILAPTAILIVFDVLNDASLDGVLMDVALRQEGQVSVSQWREDTSRVA